MTLDAFQCLLGALSGLLVGFSLSLFGGGGSILAVPLMVYVVGVPSPHVAIGTAAVGVAANAFTGLLSHARKGTVIWRCAALYSVAGVGGAYFGSTIGKSFNGQHLLFLFAILMIVVAVLMLRRRDLSGDPSASCNRYNAPKVMGFGLGTGLFSGFFGIGGGFLIVPGLAISTEMPMINAIGSSLVAVAAFGLTTAINYTISGLVDWPLAAVFVAGGIAGGVLGSGLAGRLAHHKNALATAFAFLISAAAIYVIWRGAAAFVGSKV